MLVTCGLVKSTSIKIFKGLKKSKFRCFFPLNHITTPALHLWLSVAPSSYSAPSLSSSARTEREKKMIVITWEKNLCEI